MAVSSSPTARRFELARRLKELREAADRSLADVAEELACSLAKASRIETGQRAVQPLDIKVLCRFYGVSPQLQAELMALAADARKRAWWQDFRSLDEQTITFVGLESAAIEVVQVEMLRMPGLLQTAEYTRTLVPNLRTPDFWENPDTINEIVESRKKRQERMMSGELRLHAVVDEAAFRRFTPETASVMADQVRQLVEFTALPNVTLQVVPFARGPHPGLDGPFQVMRFPERELNDLVYVEGLFGNQFLEKAELVERYREVVEYLSSAVALPAAESESWLRRLAAALRGGDEAAFYSSHNP